MKISFNRPTIQGKEEAYMADAIRRGHLSGDGYYTKECHLLLQQVLGVARVLLTTSCTHALEMAALLLDLKPGDEVIVPSFTFVSTINAFVLRGAKPVFSDVRADTLNLDEERLEQLITPRTRALVAVHYAGVGCEMDRILGVADAARVAVVEDNAHGLFGRYRKRLLGTFGVMATLSFHETKNLTCGEGGALLLNQPDLVERAEILREKGTNRSRFFRGEIDKYTWVDVGSSYLPSDLLAAFLYGQLEVREKIQRKRQEIWNRYFSNLKDLFPQRGVRLPVIPDHCEHPAHLFYLLTRSLEERQALIGHLKNDGILSVFHYQPLHLSDMGRRYGGKKGDCPVTEDISDRLVRLPLYADLTSEEQDYIIDSIRRFYTLS